VLTRVSWVAAVVLATATASLSVTPAQASAMRPVLRWTAPRQVDRGKTTIGLPQDVVAAVSSQRSRGGPTHGGIPITGISCPTASLCVAVDLNGNALVTRTPRRPATWRRFEIDSVAPLDAVSCPSRGFCASVDTMGRVVTSADPTGGSAAWTAVQIRQDLDIGGTALGVPLTAVSCASAHLCVSGNDFPREIMTATHPRGGPGAWSDQIGIGHRYSADGLVSVSCASTRFCAALGDAAIYASTAPTGPASTKLEISTSLEAISCGSRRLCVAVAGNGDAVGSGGVWRSTNPATRHPRWALSHPDPDQQFAVACRGRALCVATDSAGRVAMSAHPAASHPSWQTAHVDRSNVMSGISCPTIKLCVAADTSGNVLVGRH
jgi:hypothetical protein